MRPPNETRREKSRFRILGQDWNSALNSEHCLLNQIRKRKLSDQHVQIAMDYHLPVSDLFDCSESWPEVGPEEALGVAVPEDDP